MASFIGRSTLASGTTGASRTPDISALNVWKNDLVFCLVLLRYAGADAETITPPASQGWSLTPSGRQSIGTTASYAVYQKTWGVPGNTDDTTPTFTVGTGGKWGAILSVWRSPTGAWDSATPVQAVATNSGNATSMTSPATTSPRNQCTTCRVYCTSDNNSPNTTSEGSYAISGANVNVNTGSGYSAGWTYLDDVATGAVGTATLQQTANNPDTYVSWSFVLVPAPASCGTFLPLGQTTRRWASVSGDAAGNVYAAVYGDDIYVRTNGFGNFTATGWMTGLNVLDVCVCPNGDMYVTVPLDDIYYKAFGAGSFTALGAGALNWQGICCTPGGDVYASASLSDVYIRAGGAGPFVALGAGALDWGGMAAPPNGDVYVDVYGGDVYVRTGGIGAFTALGGPALNWAGMGAGPNNNVYAATYPGGDLYVRVGGAGSFVSLGMPGLDWLGISGVPNGNIYATVDNGDVWESVCVSPIVMMMTDVARRPSLRAADGMDVFPSSQQQAVAWGYQLPDVPRGRTTRSPDLPQVLAPKLPAPWVSDLFEQPSRSSRSDSAPQDPPPPLAVVPWADDVPDLPQRETHKILVDNDVVSALAVVPWVSDPADQTPRLAKITPPESDVLPPVAVAPTWVADASLQPARRSRQPEDEPDVVPALVVVPWAADPVTDHRATRASRFSEDLGVPMPLVVLPWGWQDDQVVARATARVVPPGDVVPPAPVVPPWGFEVDQSRVLSVKVVPPEDDVVFPGISAPVTSPWGFDSVFQFPRARTLRVDLPELVLPKPPPGPPPKPNLPIDVFIPGGGGRLPGTEVVFGPTMADVHAYLDELWEDDEDAHDAEVSADYVMGREEYERERARRSGKEPRPPRAAPPTEFRFAPTLDEVSRRRAVMLASDARLHDIPVLEADGFPLRYRLKIFDRAYEKAMRGGTMVRVTPASREMMVPLARLARVHRYRLVLWTPDSLYLFDKTTLRPKVSGAVWLAVGAGLSLWIGHDLWNKKK